jgi:hypothetical protein
MQSAATDSRTRFGYALPFFDGTKILEPEWVGPALAGANRINGASVVVKKAPPIRMFPDAVAFSYWIQMRVGEKGKFYGEIFGDAHGFIFIRIDNAGIAGAARAASQAFKMYSLLKKIGSV